MTQAEKFLRSSQAFEIFKLLAARGTTDWDFAPLAQRACDAVEAFHEVARERYPMGLAVGEPHYQSVPPRKYVVPPTIQQQSGGPRIGSVPGPEGV